MEEIKMNEELKKIAKKYNWKLEVWHGEYKGVLCGVQKTNQGEINTSPVPAALKDQMLRSGLWICSYYEAVRCSCLFCIFGNADQYASAACIEPLRMQQLIDLEQVLGCTVKRNKTLLDLCKTGRPYAAIDEQLRVLSSQEYYDLPVIMPSREKWILPAGAFAKK